MDTPIEKPTPSETTPAAPQQASGGERNAQGQQAAGTPQAPQDNRQQRGGFRGGRGGRGGQGGGRGGRNRPQRKFEKPEFDSQAIDIARVARVTKGGKRFSFRTTMIIGDGKGKVGMGIAKGRDVQQSIQKATNQARKNMVTVLIKDGTIPYQVEAKYSSASVILKPSKGGVKAGGPVRVVARMSGITSLTGKLLGRTNNKINIARATIEALKQLRARTK
jgi:small subunit ribosomal protein S5